MANSVAQTFKPRRGLALPAYRTSGGYFASKDRYDVAWGDLLIALLTPIGSRFMSRQFGSGVSRILFDAAVDQNPQLVKFVVMEAAARYCPHVVILDVRVVVDGNFVSVGISFSLAEDAASQERLVRLQRGTVVRAG